MLAPADVPAMTMPCWWASTRASANGVPQITEDSFSWLPPVMNTPVALPISATRSGSCASSRLSGRTETTSAAPSLRNSASYTSTTSGPSEDAVGDHRDPGVLAAAGRHELLEDRAPAELVLGSADDHERSRRHDREASGCKSDAVQEQTRRLVVMRHGNSRAGRADRLRATRSPSAAAPTPPPPAPGSPRRGSTRRPRAGLRGDAGPPDLGNPWPRARAGTSSRSSTAGCTPPGRRPRSTSCRPRPTRRRTLVVIGHNPTVASVAQMLDDGDGDVTATNADGAWATPPARSPCSSTTAPGPTCPRHARVPPSTCRARRLSCRGAVRGFEGECNTLNSDEDVGSTSSRCRSRLQRGLAARLLA